MFCLSHVLRQRCSLWDGRITALATRRHGRSLTTFHSARSPCWIVPDTRSGLSSQSCIRRSSTSGWIALRNMLCRMLIRRAESLTAARSPTQAPSMISRRRGSRTARLPHQSPIQFRRPQNRTSARSGGRSRTSPGRAPAAVRRFCARFRLSPPSYTGTALPTDSQVAGLMAVSQPSAQPVVVCSIKS